MWKFEYPDGRRSADVLTVPLGRPVRLVLTSRDVIHSFFVPAFRIKKDVLPGRYTTTWFLPRETGSFEIFCAEYCGTNHSRMRGSVLVLSQADYEAWLAARPDDLEEETAKEREGEARGDPVVLSDLAERGRTLAVRYGCAACHTVGGQRFVGPTWAGLWNSDVPLEGGRYVRADAAYLTRSMMDPTADIVRGFKPVMPSYRGLLAEPDVAAIVEYIRALENEGAANAVTPELPAVEAAP
jgi:cytochrome c oxidase subunit 2